MSSDLAQSDIVFAGNSSVLVEAVTTGRPSCYVPGLDHGSEDLHRFVATGLIYSIGDEPHGKRTRRESFGALNFVEMLRFYQHPTWLNVLRLFANIDEEAAAVAARAVAAIRELAVKEIKGERQNAMPSNARAN